MFSTSLKVASLGFAVLLLGGLQVGCSRDSQYYIERGNRFYSDAKFEDAAMNYRNSLKQDIRSAEAHYRLGLTEWKLGNVRSAYDEFRSAVEIDPSREDSRVQLADLALRAYSEDPQKPKLLYSQVVDTAEFLLKKNPNSFDGWRFRGGVLALDGKFPDALAAYQKASLVKPLDPAVVLPMTQVLIKSGQMAEAEDLAKKCIQAHKDAGPIYDVLLRAYISSKRMADAEALLKSKVANMPKDAFPRLQLASFYSDVQRMPDVAQTLQAILSNTQDFPNAHQIVGDFYAGKNRIDDALREFRAGLSGAAKSSAPYQKRIAKALIAQGKRAEALEELNRVIQANADDTDARLARAILLRQSSDSKDLDLAVSDLHAVLAKNGNDEVARYHLGLAYLAKGDPKSGRPHLLESARLRRGFLPPRLALAELAQREGKYDEAIRISGEIIAVDPTNVDARTWHAAGLLGNKSYQQARVELSTLLKESPNSLMINLHMAVLDTVEKKYRDAESRYQQFYKLGQKDLRPLEGLLQVYGATGQIEKGLKLLEQEVKESPDSRPIHLLLAATATRAGKLDLALQHYEWFRTNEPNSPAAYLSLGDLYQMKGDLASARASYDKARQLAPNDARTIAAVAYLQTLSGQSKEAIASYRQQLSIDPENAIAQNNLAFALADQGTDLDEALSLAEKASRKDPANPGIADTLGWVYTKKGLNDSAVQIFSGLVKKYPDEAAFRYHLGVALLQQGKRAEAKTSFTLSLSKNPPKDMADKIKGIVDKIN